LWGVSPLFEQHPTECLPYLETDVVLPPTPRKTPHRYEKKHLTSGQVRYPLSLLLILILCRKLRDPSRRKFNTSIDSSGLSGGTET